MLFIDNQGNHDPSLNLALEEYALRNLPMDETYLLFYINEPSIIIGKNQNTIEEINEDYVRENNIHVVRRLSGGGAVYHDLGNLNFSFITKDDGQSFHNFAKFTQPVIDALRSLGVEAALTGRNDIQVGERKISGNAQFATRGRMFSHGTLMFDSKMDHVASALKVKPMKIESKSTKSVRARVANIKEFLPPELKSMTIEEFRATLLKYLFNCEVQDVPQYRLTEDDWAQVRQIADSRYRTWEWNYGKSPKFNISNAYKFPSGIIDVRLDVMNGMLENIKIYGDFFGVGDIAELEDRLRGTRYEQSAVMDKLRDVDLKHYFGQLTLEQFVALLFNQQIPEA